MIKQTVLRNTFVIIYSPSFYHTDYKSFIEGDCNGHLVWSIKPHTNSLKGG